MIDVENVTFEYIRRDEDGNVSEIVEAVKNLSLQVQPGEFIGVLGCNGSGKSTFAKLLNALLEPSEGVITVSGMDTSDNDHVWKIRKNTGMVFQNPDNQIIGTVVEEDIAFGPENLGLESEEIEQRVQEALKTVGMAAYYQESPSHLSGGQKQRIAIAGVLAMHPKSIIFDEATAMLDPQGRKEVLQAVHLLNQEQNITIIYITHDMEEVIEADRLVVMHEGKLVMEGTPRELFGQGDQLKQYGLTVPLVTEVAGRLHQAGIDCAKDILYPKELTQEINRLKAKSQISKHSQTLVSSQNDLKKVGKSDIEATLTGLVLDHVTYEYNPHTIYCHTALKDINLAINKGEFIGIIGHTGSGKSTLIQQMNGLLKPTAGNIFYEGKDIYEKGYSRTYLREKVGLVFQYPEHQLFADTVYEDVAFGPKNLKLPLLEVQQRAFQAIKAVGFEDNIYDLSPFELSGGQKRRVAIAGVLAMKPDFLILDEPAAGLDPIGRKNLLEMLKDLNQEGMTIILISHNMEEIAEYAKRIIVMDQGTIALDGKTEEVFQQQEQLQALGLDIPIATKLLQELRAAGHPVNPRLYRLQDVIKELVRYLT